MGVDEACEGKIVGKIVSLLCMKNIKGGSEFLNVVDEGKKFIAENKSVYGLSESKTKSGGENKM